MSNALSLPGCEAGPSPCRRKKRSFSSQFGAAPPIILGEEEEGGELMVWVGKWVWGGEQWVVGEHTHHNTARSKRPTHTSIRFGSIDRVDNAVPCHAHTYIRFAQPPTYHVYVLPSS